MMWHVVKFQNENSVEIIPRQWYVKNTSECFWPPRSYRKDKIFKQIEACSDPMSDWKVFPVVLLGTYNDFRVAQQKVRKATITSDLSSSNIENIIPAKRKRRPNPKYSSDESSDRSQFEQISRKRVRNNKKYSSGSEQNTSLDDTEYPKIKKNVIPARRSKSYSPNIGNECEKEISRIKYNSADEFNLTNQDEDISRLYQSENIFENSPQNSKKITETKSAEINTTPKTDNNALGTTKMSKSVNRTKMPLFSLSTPEIVNELYSLESEVEQRKTKPKTSSLNDNDFKKLVVDELSSLHLKVDRLLEEVASLRRAQRSEEITMHSNYNVQMHTFHSKCPIKSIEELKDLEEWLQNENNYKLMVHEFQRIGGNSYAQAIRKILYKILTNQVGNAFSWDGAKKKEAFKKLRVANGILDAMKKQYVDISETNIIDVVKQWLVKAKERLGKEKPEESK